MKKNKLTKQEMIDNIFDKSHKKGAHFVEKKTVHYVIDSFMKELIQGVLSDKIIELRGLGTFEVRTRKARNTARNPKTGVTVKVESHEVVVFKPGKILKSSAWNLRKTSRK